MGVLFSTWVAAPGHILLFTGSPLSSCAWEVERKAFCKTSSGEGNLLSSHVEAAEAPWPGPTFLLCFLFPSCPGNRL